MNSHNRCDSPVVKNTTLLFQRLDSGGFIAALRVGGTARSLRGKKHSEHERCRERQTMLCFASFARSVLLLLLLLHSIPGNLVRSLFARRVVSAIFRIFILLPCAVIPFHVDFLTMFWNIVSN